MKMEVGFIFSKASLLNNFLVDSLREQVTTTKSEIFRSSSKVTYLASALVSASVFQQEIQFGNTSSK